MRKWLRFALSLAKRDSARLLWYFRLLWRYLFVVNMCADVLLNKCRWNRDICVWQNCD